MSKYSDNEVLHFAEIFDALSDSKRLKLFLKLASCYLSGSPCETEAGWKACVGELGKDLGIAPSTVSHHIKKLHNAGLIKMERSGKHISCWVNPRTIGMLHEFIDTQLGREHANSFLEVG